MASWSEYELKDTIGKGRNDWSNMVRLRVLHDVPSGKAWDNSPELVRVDVGTKRSDYPGPIHLELSIADARTLRDALINLNLG